jgi:putative phage-type endonuclease
MKSSMQSKITIHDVEQRSPAWHELRKGKVTGSNALILLTNGLKDALDANSINIPTNKYMQRGIDLEPQAILIYERKFGIDVLQVGFVTNTDYPNAGASPDGLLSDTVIEVKCFGEQSHRNINNIDEIPAKAMAQMQFNMLICELPLAQLVLYNPDIEVREAFKVITVPADKKIQANIISKLKPVDNSSKK